MSAEQVIFARMECCKIIAHKQWLDEENVVFQKQTNFAFDNVDIPDIHCLDSPIK